jgi:hypothetical protein
VPTPQVPELQRQLAAAERQVSGAAAQLSAATEELARLKEERDKLQVRVLWHASVVRCAPCGTCVMPVLNTCPMVVAGSMATQGALQGPAAVSGAGSTQHPMCLLATHCSGPPSRTPPPLPQADMEAAVARAAELLASSGERQQLADDLAAARAAAEEAGVRLVVLEGAEARAAAAEADAEAARDKLRRLEVQVCGVCGWVGWGGGGSGMACAVRRGGGGCCTHKKHPSRGCCHGTHGMQLLPYTLPWCTSSAQSCYAQCHQPASLANAPLTAPPAAPPNVPPPGGRPGAARAHHHL